MHSNNILVYLMLLACTAMAQIKPIFLPTEFSSINPYQFDINKNSVALSMPLCSPSQFDGCTLIAEFNLPFTRWSIPDGTYLNFTLMGNGDACGAVLCKNNPSDPKSQTNCSFVYNPRMGDRIYAIGTSGRAAGFQATFNMKINCPVTPPPKPVRAHARPEKSGLAACPVAEPTKRFVNILSYGQVKTSPMTSDAVFYTLSVCPDQKATASVTYNAQAIDQKSAMATYFCSGTDCNTNNSPPGWFDRSGTALNYVSISSLSAQILSIAVYGWGEFNDVNRFVFSIQINDQ